MRRNIGIVAPSLPSKGMRLEKVKRAIEALERMGNTVTVAPHVFKVDSYKSASARERAAELCDLLVAPDIDVVLCTTGGYNSNEMLPFLDWERLKTARAAFVGYSDVTVLLLAMLGRASIPLIQGGMLVDWPTYSEVFNDLWRVLDGDDYSLTFPAELWERAEGPREKAPPFKALYPDRGLAEGPLIAGNLSTFNLLLGTPYLPALEGALLMLEYDKEENFCLPSIERMMWQLRLAGILEKAGGLIFGALQPVVLQEQEREGRRLESILYEVTEGLSMPVFMNAPFGHMYPSWQVRQGVRSRVTNEGLLQTGGG